MKNNRSNIPKIFWFCFFRSFVPNFHFKLCSFCWCGRKNIFAPERLVP